MRVGVIAFK